MNNYIDLNNQSNDEQSKEALKDSLFLKITKWIIVFFVLLQIVVIILGGFYNDMANMVPGIFIPFVLSMRELFKFDRTEKKESLSNAFFYGCIFLLFFIKEVFNLF